MKTALVAAVLLVVVAGCGGAKDDLKAAYDECSARFKADDQKIRLTDEGRTIILEDAMPQWSGAECLFSSLKTPESILTELQGDIAERIREEHDGLTYTATSEDGYYGTSNTKIVITAN